MTKDSSTHKCKSCNEEIAQGVSKCPYCGNGGKDPKSWFGKHPIITVVLGFILLSSILPTLTTLFSNGQTQTQSSQTEQKATNNNISSFSREEVLEARKLYQIQVLEYDTSQCYGIEPDCADYVKLKITNGSKITLPFLTVKTIRYDQSGKRIGSSRAPSIPTSNIKPGESFTYDYYPLGHFSPIVAVTDSIQVEIEHVIDPEAEQFFNELTNRTSR